MPDTQPGWNMEAHFGARAGGMSSQCHQACWASQSPVTFSELQTRSGLPWGFGRWMNLVGDPGEGLPRRGQKVVIHQGECLLVRQRHCWGVSDTCVEVIMDS